MNIVHKNKTYKWTYNMKTNPSFIYIENYTTPLHCILGGAPMYPDWHSQWNPPGVFVQTENEPHGCNLHSSISTQTEPLALKPFWQKHCPSIHSALFTHSNLLLHTTVTSTYTIKENQKIIYKICITPFIHKICNILHNLSMHCQ